MPASPISPSRPQNSASETRTRRSSVSRAYNFMGLAPKESSAKTAGTITNPSATAAELLAAQPPNALKSPSTNQNIPSAISVTKPFQTSSTKVTFVPNSLINSQGGGSSSQPVHLGVNPPTASNIGRLLQGKGSSHTEKQTTSNVGSKPSDGTPQQESSSSPSQTRSPASSQQTPEVRVESPNKLAIL